jgi:hypothetical protein
MSEIIKPEDVPDVLVEHYLPTNLGISWRHLIAADINAAIEAGLVSPPCHVKRHLGELECQGGTLDPQLFIGKPKEEGDEHWKGQTK